MAIRFHVENMSLAHSPVTQALLDETVQMAPAALG